MVIWRLILRGTTPNEICQTVGVQVSKSSMRRWLRLSKTTQVIITDPALYKKSGPERLLTVEQEDFLVDALRDDPTRLPRQACRKVLWHASHCTFSRTSIKRTQEPSILASKDSPQISPKSITGGMWSVLTWGCSDQSHMFGLLRCVFNLKSGLWYVISSLTFYWYIWQPHPDSLSFLCSPLDWHVSPDVSMIGLYILIHCPCFLVLG